MKTFIKNLFLIVSLVILLSFGFFSLVKAEEQKKEIEYLESEIERLEDQLDNCPK